MLVGMVQIAQAQDEAVFTHHPFNQTLVNPAASGFDAGHHNLFLNFRSAWSNFPGTPKTYALSYNGPVAKRLGLGAMIFSESAAAITRYRAQLSYAFNYSIQDLKMALGFSTELHRMRINNDELTNSVNDLEDETLMDAIDGKREFDATAGIFGSYKDRVYFGAAFPNLVRGSIDNINGEEDGFLSSFLFQVGGRFDINDYKVKLQPQILIKKVSCI